MLLWFGLSASSVLLKQYLLDQFQRFFRADLVDTIKLSCSARYSLLAYYYAI